MEEIGHEHPTKGSATARAGRLCNVVNLEHLCGIAAKQSCRFHRSLSHRVRHSGRYGAFDLGFACAREIVTPQRQAGSQRVRAEHVGQELHQRRADPFEFAGKLIDSRGAGRNWAHAPDG